MTESLAWSEKMRGLYRDLLLLRDDELDALLGEIVATAPHRVVESLRAQLGGLA